VGSTDPILDILGKMTALTPVADLATFYVRTLLEEGYEFVPSRTGLLLKYRQNRYFVRVSSIPFLVCRLTCLNICSL